MGIFDFENDEQDDEELGETTQKMLDRLMKSGDTQEKEKKERNHTSAKTGASIQFNNSVSQSVVQTRKHYTKPDYNPQTRRDYYDDPSAHKRAIDQAFSKGGEVVDPYTKQELLPKQSDAKLKYGGDNWQEHAAEADHIEPISRLVERVKKDPLLNAFTTTEDLQRVANRDGNVQVISRKNNQGSKEAGKGGSTQEEWANDAPKMDNLAARNEEGESSTEIKENISRTGEVAEKGNSEELIKSAIKNAATTAHEAGKAAAQQAGVTTLTMVGIMNIVDVINGKKDVDDAICETVEAGGKAALSGYLMGGGMTTVAQALSSSSSQFVQALIKSNVPGKVITAVMATGDTLKRWVNGELDDVECLTQLGEKGLNMATMGYSMMVGQALIPIPIVGGAIGALVGSMLTSNLYNTLVQKLQKKKLEHEERQRIIRECNEIVRRERAFREELQSYLDSYFKEYRKCFDEALSSIKVSYEMGDADGTIAAANQITRKLGGKVQYETVAEFRDFLNDGAADIF